jgi:hypothetical protein
LKRWAIIEKSLLGLRHPRPDLLPRGGQGKICYCGSTPDVLKIKLAAQLRRQTTMTLTWIAERLQRGVPVNGSIYENQTQTGSS